MPANQNLPPVVIPKKYTATLVAKEQLSPKVMLLQLEPAASVTFTEGQYASFLIGNQRRTYSFASSREDKLLDFVIDVSPGGVGSTWAKQLILGQAVAFLAPFGRFTLQPGSRPLLFIATGAGIAPIRGHIKQGMHKHDPRPMTLVFGNQNEKYCLHFDEFETLAKQARDKFTFIPVCSDPSEAWSGERGLVTHITPTRIRGLPQYDIYICGSPAMVKDTVTMLQEHEVPLEQIHTEKFL